MTIMDIIVKEIKAHGADGLANTDFQCGCPLDCLAPCGDWFSPDCQLAKSRILQEGEHRDTAEPGDRVYEPTEALEECNHFLDCPWCDEPQMEVNTELGEHVVKCDSCGSEFSYRAIEFKTGIEFETKIS